MYGSFQSEHSQRSLLEISRVNSQSNDDILSYDSALRNSQSNDDKSGALPTYESLVKFNV